MSGFLLRPFCWQVVLVARAQVRSEAEAYTFIVWLSKLRFANQALMVHQ